MDISFLTVRILQKNLRQKEAKDGIFLSFQNPILKFRVLTVSGNFIRTALEQRTGSRIRALELS